MIEFGHGLPETIKLPHALPDPTWGSSRAYNDAVDNIVAAYKAGINSKLRPPLNENQMGNLYMLYFFGKQTVDRIANEVNTEEYSREQIADDLEFLRGKEWVSREMTIEGFEYDMTDEGKDVYVEWCPYYGFHHREPNS